MVVSSGCQRKTRELAKFSCKRRANQVKFPKNRVKSAACVTWHVPCLHFSSWLDLTTKKRENSGKPCKIKCLCGLAKRWLIFATLKSRMISRDYAWHVVCKVFFLDLRVWVFDTEQEIVVKSKNLVL